MKKFTALALVAGLSAAGAQAQDNYQLIYDADTGNVSIQTNTSIAENTPANHPVVANQDVPAAGNLINYVLETSNPIFDVNSRIPGPDAAMTPGTIAVEEVAPGVFFATGTVTNETGFQAESNSNRVSNGAQLHNLGNILPAGLSEQQWNDLLDVNRTYVRNLGTDQQQFDLVYIPEPTSLALLGLGGLLVARRRR